MASFYETDLAIIGSSCVGLACALSIAILNPGFKIVVIEKGTTANSGDTALATGGVRALHSEQHKRFIASRSIEHFAKWQSVHQVAISGFLLSALDKLGSARYRLSSNRFRFCGIFQCREGTLS